MALILCIETATPICSVALQDAEEWVATEVSIAPQSTASQLAVMIDRLFKKTDTSVDQLSAVAVSAGPGSYTGLRIGVATAKGICFAKSLPLISINTLELMVHQTIKDHQFKERSSLLCPMLDARRMEVYCLLTDTKADIIESTQAKVIESSSFGEWLQKNEVYFFGDGASKCKQIITHPHAIFIEDVHPSARHMGPVVWQKFISGKFEDLPLYEPFYLKDFMIKKPI
jgi:tRNA threonylcarbamoyladenosine biosynthesis protein TsaB